MASIDSSKAFAIKLTRFFMSFAGFWIWKDQRGKFFMDMAMTYTIVAILVAWMITGSDLWYSRTSFYHGAYAACNAMTVLIILLKLTVFTIRREAFMNLIKYSYENFWQRDYDKFGESVIRDCEIKCIYFVGTFTFFAQCTVCSYTIHPIVENYGKNESERILPFNVWLNLPMSTTPYYEIMFFIETLSLIHSGICYFCFDNLLCIMNVYVAGQFRILQRRLELIFDENDVEHHSDPCKKISSNKIYNEFLIENSNSRRQHDEFKCCVRQHQMLIEFTKKIEDVYMVVILGQVVIFSILICLVTYQAVLAEGSIQRRMIFIVHSAGTFTQLFMFTLTCDSLIQESHAVADAVYHARWYSGVWNPVTRELRRDLILVIMKARRPCCLSAGGFFPISLETFTTILSTSLSYLTLLRQGQENSVH